MKIETEEQFSIDTCLANPDKLYVFGENAEQQSSNSMGGGQAIIRGCPNSFGFCTLDAIGKFWVDKKYLLNVAKIESDIQNLKTRAEKYNTIVFPKYGLGTGRAKMITSCPRTFLYMCTRLLEEFNFNNIQHLTALRF